MKPLSPPTIICINGILSHSYLLINLCIPKIYLSCKIHSCNHQKSYKETLWIEIHDKNIVKNEAPHLYPVLVQDMGSPINKQNIVKLDVTHRLYPVLVNDMTFHINTLETLLPWDALWLFCKITNYFSLFSFIKNTWFCLSFYIL